jgi:type IV pilus assembly protein PilO
MPTKDEFLAQVVAAPIQKKAGVMAAIIALLIGGFWYFSIDSERQKIKKARSELAELKRQQVEKAAIANNLAKFRREVEKLNQDLKDAVALLPNEAEIPELLQKVSELVEKSGLQMDVFELMGEQPVGFYARVPVKVEVSGSFHEVVVFLDKLAKLSRIVNVTDIKLGEPAFKNQKMALKSAFLATTFRFVETKQAGQPGPGGQPGGAAPAAK